MIVQNGMSAFDPLIKIGKQVSQTLIYHFSYTKLQAFNATKQALDEVFEHQSLMIMQAFPHQLSGGQLQRVMIAMALALSPRLLIADEPTTALDAPLRREILQLLQRITISKNTTLIFISHDLGLVSQIADDILVMKEGKLIEFGDKNSVLDTPKQAYTRYLIEARAKLSQRFAQVLYARWSAWNGDKQQEDRMLLRVDNVSKYYYQKGARFFKEKVTILDALSFNCLLYTSDAADD